MMSRVVAPFALLLSLACALCTPTRWTNRPTFQQVIELGHRR